MKKRKVVSNKISYIKPLDAGILMAVFCMFIMLVASVSVGTKKYKESQLFMIQDTMEILAANQKVQFEQYIDNKVSLLQGLAKFPEIYKMDMDEQRKFIRGRSQSLGFHHLFIMRENGTAYYVEEERCRNQKEEPFYNYVMQNDIYITEPFYGTDATTMTISVSILDENGRKVGALCGAIELKTIEEMFQENKMFLNGKSYLINRDGFYVMAHDMDKVYQKVAIYEEPDSDVTLVEQAFEERADQNGTLICEGIEYQANVTYLQEFDWVIVQCIEKEEIFKDLEYIDVWRYVSLAIVVILILCVIRIIVYWNRSNKKINTDTLTGCNSRAAIQNILEHLSLMKQDDISIVYFDLNNFKKINDTYGHDYGDKLLCIFSDVLVSVFGVYGHVGRLGGDEFMVIILNMQEEVITALCEEVNRQLQEKGKELNIDSIISTSYGFATRKKGSNENLHSIMNKADERMYSYKEQSR